MFVLQSGLTNNIAARKEGYFFHSSIYRTVSKKSKMLYVYIAGPYTKGNVNENVRRAILAGERVKQLGFTPFVPHLYHLWDIVSPQPYDYWMQLDFNWLSKCDVLMRIPGESRGADQEVEFAEAHGKPVLDFSEQGLVDLQRLATEYRQILEERLP